MVYVCVCSCVRVHVCTHVSTHRYMPAMACVVVREQFNSFQESLLTSSCESQVLNSCLPACAEIAFTSEVTLRVPFRSYMRTKALYLSRGFEQHIRRRFKAASC